PPNPRGTGPPGPTWGLGPLAVLGRLTLNAGMISFSPGSVPPPAGSIAGASGFGFTFDIAAAIVREMSLSTSTLGWPNSAAGSTAPVSLAWNRRIHSASTPARRSSAYGFGFDVAGFGFVPPPRISPSCPTTSG